jgi:2-keto-4-pentenoate hydratase/2-oxohepta-3-ene-1,7-dioic acid hydratase in catechol pathway
MKLVSHIDSDGRVRIGGVLGDRVADLTEVAATGPLDATAAKALAIRGIPASEPGMLRLLFGGEPALEAARRQLERTADRASLPLLSSLRLLAPVPRPGKIVAIGRNYGEHAREAGSATFERPRIIAKLPSSVASPGSSVPIPAGVTKLDFEVELAVVIGRFARNVPRDRALDAVAGYTVLDDVSAREFQFDVSPPQTTFAKSMDGFCPMGPWLVTRDEVPDPQRLDIACTLNGETVQQASTADMIFPVDVLIEYITRFMTLEPGDVIATGTPSGVGAFRTPPVWLKAGDRLRLEVSGVGVLEHGIG